MSTVLKSDLSDMQLRAKVEEMVTGDLLGPAGGENEELVERNVRDRYLVGVLAPAKRSGEASAAPSDDEEETQSLVDPFTIEHALAGHLGKHA